MPLIEHTNLTENSNFALWKITETKEELQALLPSGFRDNGVNRHENLHWLASRVLLNSVFQFKNVVLHKNEFNKPLLEVDENRLNVSITHSYAYAAVLVNAYKSIAVDLERIDNRILRVARKFQRDDELLLEDYNHTAALTVLWSAKETLYKFYGMKELDFKTNLFIQPFSYTDTSFEIMGTITKGNQSMLLPITVRTFDGYVLTYIA
jgi:4'-phosphopantetheinyl transferase